MMSKSGKLSWPIAKGQNWLGTIGKAPWEEVSRWSPKPCPIQLSMLEPANVIRVQLASYAFEEVFSQPALRVKDGETRGAFMAFWKRYIVWKKYCNRFCNTLNTGTLPRNPPFHWKAELIFKSYRLQKCRNFLVHFSVAPNLLSFGIFLVASILFQPFYFCVLFSLQKLDWGTSSVPCWLLRRSAICAFGCFGFRNMVSWVGMLCFFLEKSFLGPKIWEDSKPCVMIKKEGWWKPWGEEMSSFLGSASCSADGSQVVVTCWNPAVIWVWPEPYLRCAVWVERVCVWLKICVESAAGFVKKTGLFLRKYFWKVGRGWFLLHSADSFWLNPGMTRDGQLCATQAKAAESVKIGQVLP